MDEHLDSRLDLLLRLVESITASPDLDEVLGRVMTAADRLVSDSVATLWILEGDRLVARARGGARRSGGSGRTDVAVGEGLVGHAALERRTILVDDVRADPRTVDRALCEIEALVGGTAIPLISHGTLLGVLALFTRRPGNIAAADVEMLTAFGGHAAIAIESARHYADAERRRREAETLAGVARDLAESHDLDSVLARITKGAHTLCGGDLASLALREDDGVFTLRHVIGARSEAYPRLRITPGYGLGGCAAVSGRPARAAERIAWPPMPAQYAETLDEEGIRSALVVPIVIGQVVEGLLYVSSRAPRTFSDAEERVLLELADHAAAAIRNRRLFTAEQRARAEAESEARSFQNLVDSLDAIVLEADAATFEVTFVNRRVEGMLGYPVEQWYGDPNFWVSRLHPDDVTPTVTECSAAIAEGRDHVSEYRMLAADGRYVWLRDMVRVLPGSPRRLRCVMVDVTERKRAEALLAGEREILGRIAAGAPIGTVLDGICRMIESLSEDMLASVLLVEGGARLRHGAAPSLPEEYTRAIDGAPIGPAAGCCGTAAYLKQTVIAPDIAIDPRWTAYRDLALPLGLRSCWSTPVLDAEGKVMATFALYHRMVRSPRPDEEELVQRAAQIIRIALERDQATVALQRSEERYRELVGNIPAVTWLADAGGRIVFVSPNAQQVTGYTAEEMSAHGVEGRLGWIHPEDVHLVRAQYTALVRARAPFDVEYRMRHKDGRWIWIHDRAVSTYEEDGVVHVAGVLADITDRKQANVIRSLLLRQVVHVQEAERARLARELHDDTAQSLAALLIGLHRLRGARRLADAREQAEKLHAVAAHTLEEVRRMSRGLRPRALDDFGLVPVFERHAAEFGEMRGLDITVRAEGLDDGRLPADVETALYRVMQEALSNVARHSGASKAQVTLERRAGLVTMVVTDDGRGFDATETLRATDRTTGLGLHSIRERVAVLGGSATIDSSPGRGTCVTVEIPIAPEA
jgi:PAS domain S-box-containing protein